jgi:hypothetical protein
MLVLIDGDILRYRCAFAAERSYYLVELTNQNGHKEWTKFESKKEAKSYSERVTRGVNANFDIWTKKDIQPVEFALQACKTSLEAILTACAGKDGIPDREVEYRIYISGDENFRDEIAKTKTYKGNRKAPKPTYYTEVGDYLTSKWKAEITDGIEADDAIGISAMEAKEKGLEYVVVSNDKDLDQIPGLHYDWTKSEFYTVSPKEAKTRFFIQLLAGDSTDNIPGIPGIGEVKATQILRDAKSPEEMVELCAEWYAGPDMKWTDKEYNYLLEQASLVYIRRDESIAWIDTKEGQYFKRKYATN